MDLIERLIEARKNFSLELDYEYSVYITHVNNPHSFYVRPQEYNRYMATIQARGSHVKKSEIKIGSIVIFKSKVSKDHVRGKIIFIEGENDQITCDMFALDIGYTENRVPLKKIWKPYHQVDLPALAFHCRLANCKPLSNTWQESTNEAVRLYVKGKVAEILIKEVQSDKYVVEVSISLPDDLATLLAITKHSNFEKIDLEYQLTIWLIHSEDFYPERLLIIKSVLHVCLISGFFIDKFYAAQVDEYKTYLEDRDDYTEYANNEKSLLINDLKLNGAVGVFYHRTNKYERGIVKEIFPKKKKAKVELVDNGRTIEESVDVMKPIPNKYLTKPPLAILCSLHVSQYSKLSLTEISNLAYSHKPGVEFSIKVEEVSEVSDSPNLVVVFDMKT